MTVAVVVATVLGAVVLVAWFFTSKAHPERGSGHADDEARETTAARLYGTNPPGPAGPDAESQNADDVGNAMGPPPPPPVPRGQRPARRQPESRVRGTHVLRPGATSGSDDKPRRRRR
jgi:hypothetical protein